MIGFEKILKFITFLPSQRMDWADFVSACPPEELLGGNSSPYHDSPNMRAKQIERCLICGSCMSIDQQFDGDRCLDPAHWQASGALSPSDYTLMAQIEARAHAEKRKRVYMPRS